MSRIRVVAARLYAAFIHAQLFVMSCRSKLTKFLLLIPMMLLPKAVLADGDLADMVRNVEQGAKTAQSSSLTIAQFIGVILFLGGLIGLKKLGNKGGWDWLVAFYLSSLGRYLSPDLNDESQPETAGDFHNFHWLILSRALAFIRCPSCSAIQGGTYVCLEPGAHNVTTNRKRQCDCPRQSGRSGIHFAECCSDEIANIILEAVKRYTSTEPAHATQH